MIEFVLWRVMLWLVDYRERVRWRNEVLTSRFHSLERPWRNAHDLVFRLSPWVPGEGYRRPWIRSVLWRVMHPLITLRLASLRRSLVVLDAFLPYVGPGKYEGMSDRDRVMTEWLDTHLEYADRETGDTDWGIHAALFVLTPPWSRSEETWLMTTDSRGFVEAVQYRDGKLAVEDFDEIDAQYNRGIHDHEGDPEFNGAFA